jgi:sialate O-acetylesterase
MKKVCSLVAVLGVALSATSARADVKLPSIFGDHMVLQQKTDAPVWGWADADEEVTVTLGDAKATTKRS